MKEACLSKKNIGTQVDFKLVFHIFDILVFYFQSYLKINQGLPFLKKKIIGILFNIHMILLLEHQKFYNDYTIVKYLL